MEVTIPPMKSNPLYDVKPNELYDEIPSNTNILTALTSPTTKCSDRYNIPFIYPGHKNQPELPPPRKMGVPLNEAKFPPKTNPVGDNDSDKEDYVEMSAIGSQGNLSQPRSPLTPNQTHNATGRNSMYSNINAPPTMANFQQRYSLNMEDSSTSLYSHLQNTTVV